jgi:hypothetical protein
MRESSLIPPKLPRSICKGYFLALPNDAILTSADICTDILFWASRNWN